MFDIAFLDEPLYIDQEGWRGLWLEIVLGTFKERMIAPVTSWRRLDYEAQWIEGAERLLSQHAIGAFVTEPFRLWWVAWRSDVTIRVRQEFIIPERLESVIGLTPTRTPYEIIDPEPQDSDSEYKAAEWEVSPQDIEEFLQRRGRHGRLRES